MPKVAISRKNTFWQFCSLEPSRLLIYQINPLAYVSSLWLSHMLKTLMGQTTRFISWMVSKNICHTPQTINTDRFTSYKLRTCFAGFATMSMDGPYTYVDSTRRINFIWLDFNIHIYSHSIPANTKLHYHHFVTDKMSLLPLSTASICKTELFI